jgi:hypothetical protein
MGRHRITVLPPIRGRHPQDSVERVPAFPSGQGIRNRIVTSTFRLSLAMALVVAVIATFAQPAAAAPSTDCTKFVSTTGSDSASGSFSAPWRNVLQSINKATAGTVLCVMPGTYSQEVVDPALPDGTATQRVVVKSYDPANRATIDGRVSLSNLSFWTIRDLRFTNPTPTTTSGASTTSNIDRRIVALMGGNDVVFANNEVFNGQYSGILVGRATATSEIPHRYTLRGNYVHDTQSASLYFNPGRWSTGNLIERNRFVNAGSENSKIGWGDDCRGVTTDSDAYGAGQVEFRYNTLHNGGFAGSFVVAEPGGLYEVRVHHNIFSDPQSERGFVVRYDSATNSTDFPNGCLGDKVYVTDNIGIGGTKYSEDFGDAPVSRSHESGNKWPVDPQFDSNYVPRNTAAQAYGHAAP